MHKTYKYAQIEKRERKKLTVKPVMVAHDYNSSSQEVEARGPQVLRQQHTEFNAALAIQEDSPQRNTKTTPNSPWL